MTTITVQPVREDLSFGARVGGVDPEALADPGLRAEIVDLFETHGLLIFEGVDPTPKTQVVLSTVFGPLKDHPSQAVERADDELLGVIEMRHTPEKPGKVRVDGRLLSQWLPWHFDHCYTDQLNRAGVLRAVEIPPDGGLTGFVDGIALYEAIPADVRGKIEGRDVIYAMDVIMSNLRYGRPADFTDVEIPDQATQVMEEFASRPRAVHPAVWTRRTGEKVLHVSPWMAKGIVGLDDADADALLREVCDALVAAAEGLCYFHQWRPTHMLIWDNWRCLHRVSGMDPEHTRCMHRTTIAGDYGLGRFETEPA